MKLAEDDEVSVEVAALPVRLHPSPAVKEGAWGVWSWGKWLQMCLDIWRYLVLMQKSCVTMCYHVLPLPEPEVG